MGCTGCGRTYVVIRADGQCFRCHCKGIGFTFVGGGGYGRGAFHESTTAEFLEANVGRERIRSGEVERV